MKHLLSILIVLSALAGTAAAKGVTPGGDNNDDRGNPKAAAAKATRVEELMWILPQSHEEMSAARVDQAELEKVIVDLYKWYLQTNNSKTGTNSQFFNSCGKELMFNFKVDPKILQQYLQFIKNNFPGLSEEDLKRTASNRKKFAPVSTRDDIESPMSFSLTK